ncbi:oxidoreductase [Candidatus Kaiserbacteria bacterium RIFCSPHIGHO2_01_FULL_49_13]|uniref:Oxidoreductase n=1 Tax=Candidatus Kaiserbacteria bacterium RIFCSPHIGHO2_01_FULL_49_13 TaxID=1798477 RepID=A0A1F6CDV4_9BACT|nr:MAG: oxidoreductase [Candidatus Kaiserbacteria bacterium RIFCSPHIGHO2_01_FULL_49_13]
MARYHVKLVDKRDIARGTMAFRFEKPASFAFTAGQHVDIVQENPARTDEKGNGRDLSIAASPHEPWLEIATRMTGSAFKENLKNMPIGEEFLIKGPGGDFMLHQDSARPAVFLIGGIGITPIRSIILDAAHRKLPHKLFLFYSNRTPETTAYLEDLENAAGDNPNFTLISTMTKLEGYAGEWKGERGFIEKGLLARYLKNISNPVYYLAGPEAMVGEMRKLAVAMGADDLSIRAEEFPGY